MQGANAKDDGNNLRTQRIELQEAQEEIEEVHRTIDSNEHANAIFIVCCDC